MPHNFECYPCGMCPQEESCECFGEPVAALTMQGYDVQSCSPQSCFFYVCDEGRLEALKAYRKARETEKTGKIPFGTGHKPHTTDCPAGLDVKGRFVARSHKFLADYDVIAVVNGVEKRLINVK